MKSILLFGAVNDGKTDCSQAFNKAFSSSGAVFIPEGNYLICSTLKISSDVRVCADKNAVIKLADGAQKGRYDFFLTNEDKINGNSCIEINGGVWDANCSGNDRGDDLFDPKATTGCMFSFRNIKNLKLCNMKLKNPLCYYMRFCEAENVIIDNITFCSDNCAINQDGLHFAGYCRFFHISNLYGTAGSPDDDFLAFNADDCLTRQESFDMINGPISDFRVENIHSDLCHCFIRFLSLWSEISNIYISGVTGKCKQTAICIDAARYCRVPLFKDTDAFASNGVGFIKNVLVKNMNISSEHRGEMPLITAETNCENFVIHNFCYKDEFKPVLFTVRNVCNHDLQYITDAEHSMMITHDDFVSASGQFLSYFSMDRN